MPYTTVIPAGNPKVAAPQGACGRVPVPWRLPGKWSHIELRESCTPHRSQSCIWRAQSDRASGKLLIVQFRSDVDRTEAAEIFQKLGVPFVDDWFPGQPDLPLRFAIDTSGMPLPVPAAVAVVTVLPIALPSPYQDLVLTDFIGVGGQGEVWAAESPDFPSIRLAVKFYTAGVEENWSGLAALCDEAQAGLEIVHQHVVHTRKFLDLQAHAGCGWHAAGFVMEQLEISLARVLEDCRLSGVQLPQSIAVDLCRHLVQGVDALHHDWKRVHRDLKPANILLRFAQGVKFYYASSLPAVLERATALISDLGFICRAGEVPPVTLGNDGYKAPELFPPDRDQPVDPSQDLWAL
ncbi:MAG: hypothetical protein JSS02_30250, partial [Planctomycetes bacterium]|nr:hypothetical protein [Planctomycetota bacterium]